MKFLTPEIEALSNCISGKSLVRQSTSCGIFQDCDYIETTEKLYQELKSK